MPRRRAQTGCLFPVLELRVPGRMPAFRRAVEDGPQRHQVGGAARVLAGIGALGTHLAAPEMADRAVAAGEHVEAGDVAAIRRDAEVVAAEVARSEERRV